MTLMLLLGCIKAPDVTMGVVEPLPLVATSRDARWHIPVEVNGEQWVWFVDTGYAVTTCDDDLAEELKLELFGRAIVRGETGRLVASRTELPPFELGGHRVEGLRCVVRDLDRTSSIRDPDEVHIAGVLGMDVLGAFKMTTDPEQLTLTLEPPGEPIEGMRFKRTWHDPRPRLRVQVGGRTVWPHADTGTRLVYLDGKRLGLEPIARREDVVVRGTGTGEAVRDILQYREAIGFAGGQLDEVVINGRRVGRGSKGLVGLAVLSRFVITWDFPNRLVAFEPTRWGRTQTWTEWRSAERPPVHSRFVTTPER